MRIKGFDFLRVMAVMAVFLFHYQSFNNPNQHFRSHLPWLQNHISGFGFLGVDCFFIISGAVIVKTSKKRTPSAFLKARVLRLLPAMAVIFPILFFIERFTNISSRGKSFPDYNSLLFTNFVSGSSALDDVLWSLWIELHFYLIVAFILYVSRKQNFFLISFGLLNLVIFYAPGINGILAEVFQPLFLPYFLLRRIRLRRESKRIAHCNPNPCV